MKMRSKTASSGSPDCSLGGRPPRDPVSEGIGWNSGTNSSSVKENTWICQLGNQTRAFHPSILPLFSTLPSFHPSILPPFHPSILPSFHPSILPPFHPSTLPSFVLVKHR